MQDVSVSSSDSDVTGAQELELLQREVKQAFERHGLAFDRELAAPHVNDSSKTQLWSTSLVAAAAGCATFALLSTVQSVLTWAHEDIY